MLLTHLAASIALLAGATGAKAAAPVTPFSPGLEYDGGGVGLCRDFLADVQADFFDGAPGFSKAQTHRKFPQVFADPLSDSLVDLNDPESFYSDSFTRYWGDIDGDGDPEEIALTTYFGDGASGYRLFVALTKLDRVGVEALRREWRRLFESGHQDPGLKWRGRASGIIGHIRQDTYRIVADFGVNTGPSGRFWKREPAQIRNAPDDDHLKRITIDAVNYRHPFRVIAYRGRLYAETIVSNPWRDDDRVSIAARRILLSFDAAMRPRPECIVAELPEPSHPLLPLSKSKNLQALLSTVEAIEGESCDNGSLNIEGFHRSDRRALVREVGARPWLISEETVRSRAFANKSVAIGDYDWLRIWRRLGPWNAKKFDEMENRGAEAQSDLADYFSSAFKTDNATARDWSKKSIHAIKAAAALGAPEINRKLSPLTDKIDVGTAIAEDYLEMASFLRNPYRREEIPGSETLADALGLAVAANADDSVLEVLIARGADINAGDQTALVRAIGDPRRVESLLKRGAKPDKPNNYGKTPLMMAAHLGDLKSLRILLDQSVNVNARTNDPDANACYRMNIVSRTALMYAAENASPRLIMALLKAGADATAVDNRDHGMLNYLSLNANVSEREREKIHQALVRAGATR